MRKVVATLSLVAALGAAACAGAEATLEPQPAGSPEIGSAVSIEGDEAAATEGSAAAEEVTDLGGMELLIGTDATYPPFESMNDEGDIVGVDPSLMDAVCELANCVPVFQSTSWDGIFPALAAREFDVLMSAITILPEREEESNATFTAPYFEVGQVVLVRAGDTAIESADDLLGDVKVAVQTGTTGDTAATEQLGVPEANMARFGTIVDAVQALLGGDADAVVLDNPTAEIFTAQHEGDLTVVGEPFTTEQYGILVPNDRPAVLSALNAAIEQLVAEDRVASIAAEWFQVEE